MSSTVCKRLTTLAASLACASLALPASATTLTYGVPLSGTGPSVTFASLTYNQVGDGDDWSFTLSALDLTSLFASSGAFIGTIAVEVPGSSPGYGGGLAMTGVSGGVAGVEAKNGGGPGGSFDFRLDLGGGSDKLKANESVSWTWNNSGYSAFTQFALHVQGLEANTAGYSSSIWYVPATPVPEPETYALMLAGLGVVGWFSRRRRS